MPVPESKLEHRWHMLVLTDQLRDLKQKYADVTNPAYTKLSPMGELLLRSAIQALEAKLTELATEPVPHERKEDVK